MKIKGDKVKDNKPLLSGRLYRLDESRTVIFEERETGDVVNIIFTIGNHQYGIYGNEYKPPLFWSLMIRGEVSVPGCLM